MKNRAAQEQLSAYDASLNTNNYHQQHTLTKDNLTEAILPHIKIVMATNIRIEGNARAQIIKDICHIHFSKLEYLNLNNSQIANIECIRYFSCPNLRVLELYGNFITNMNPLANAIEMKRLDLVSIYKNPLKDKWKTERQFMPIKNKYEFDYSGKQFSHTIEDMSFLVKAQCGKILKTYATGKDRIHQRKLLKLFQDF